MKMSFPWLALGLGLVIAVLLGLSGAVDPAASPALPLLLLLLLNEFGFVLTAIGAGLALRDATRDGFSPTLLMLIAGCAALAAGFLWLGLKLWPGLT